MKKYRVGSGLCRRWESFWESASAAQTGFGASQLLLKAETDGGWVPVSPQETDASPWGLHWF